MRIKVLRGLWWGAVLAATVLSTAHAGLRNVESFHERTWATAVTENACQLQQTIPGYGVGTFSRSDASPLRLTISSYADIASPADGELISVSPLWRHDAAPRSIVRAWRSPGRVPFAFGPTASRHILAELEHGQAPTLVFNDPDLAAAEQSLRLSPIGLLSALDAFRSCVAKCKPLEPSRLNGSRLLFASASWHLDNAAKQILDDVLLRLIASPNVKRVSLTGHSDSAGPAYQNDELSRRRMLAAANYLIAHGVPDTLLKTAYRGESSPLRRASAATNRRVEIQLQFNDG